MGTLSINLKTINCMKKRPEYMIQRDRLMYVAMLRKAQRVCREENVGVLKVMYVAAQQAKHYINCVPSEFSNEIHAGEAIYRARQGVNGLIIALDMAVKAMEGAIEDINEALRINTQAEEAALAEKQAEEKKAAKKAYDRKHYMKKKAEQEAQHE